MDRSDLDRVRGFNRLVTLRTGALDASYLGRGRPLGEARLLFEIEAGGSELGALRQRLGLDSGYFSRLLRALERQGLVTTRPAADDRRRRIVAPTASGLAEKAGYDALSDDLARGFLAPLGATQRRRLVAAMAEVEALLTAGAVEFASEPQDGAVARQCLDAYFAELAERFEGGFDRTQGNVAGDLSMAPPGGCFLVARLDGRPVACGGLRTLAPGTGEIKRMWVADDVRGLGIARRLLAALEDQARHLGMGVVRLDTNRALDAARALYIKAGYAGIDRFNDNPYADFWFEKVLGGA